MSLPVPQTITPNDRGLRMLLYGDTGVGKTSFGASAAQHSKFYPMLALNTDDGFTSIAHINIVNQKLGIPVIKSIRLTQPKDALAIANELIKPVDQRSDDYKDIKTLFIDSISAWRDQTLSYVVERNTKLDAARGKSREVSGLAGVPQLQDYGGMTMILISVMNAFCQNDLNLIVTAGVDQVIDENGIVIDTAPLLNNKLRQAVYHMMDFIWFMKEKNNKYKVLTLPNGPYKIKTRNVLFFDLMAQQSDKGWFELGIDENGYITPNIGYFYDLFMSSIKGEDK